MTAAKQDNAKAVIRCTDCGASFRVPRQFLDREAKCTKCGARFKAVEAGKGPRSADDGEKSLGDGRLGSKLGQFRLLAILGRGAMGNVYEAEDTLLQRRVAVKVLPPQLMAQGGEVAERFLREARSAGRLDHPNIVGVYQVGVEKGLHYIAMQLVRGGSAADFLKDHGPMTPQDATRVALEAARALAAAHGKGIVHRDIKPGNIMLGEAWSVKVADFGLAKVEGSDLTKDGHILGTPAYMSPEACRGQPSDFRSDLYSLGCTYFALLTGRAPFVGENTHSVMYQQIYEPPPDPRTLRPEVPGACVRVLMKALAKEPAERYQTADEFAEALAGIDFTGVRTDPSQADSMQNWAALVAATQGTLAEQAALADFKMAPPISSTRLPLVSGRSRKAGLPAWVWGATAAAGAFAFVAAAMALRFGGGDPKPPPASKKPSELVVDPLRPVTTPPDTPPTPTDATDPELDAAAREFAALVGRAEDAARKGPAASLAAAMEALRGFAARVGASPKEPVREFARQAAAVHERFARGFGDPLETGVGPTALAFDASNARVYWIGRERGEPTLGMRDLGSGLRRVAARPGAGFAGLAVGSAGHVVTLGQAAGGADELVHWTLQIDGLAASRAEPGRGRTAVAVSRDGKLLAVAGPGLPVTVRPSAGGAGQTISGGDAGQVGALAFSPDGGLLAIGDDQGRVHVWEIAAAPQVRSVARAVAGAVRSLAFTADGGAVAAVGSEGGLRFLSLDGRASPGMRPLDGVSAATLSADGRTAAAAGRDGRVWLWDLRSAEPPAKLPGHTGPVSAVAFSPDGTAIASASTEDGTVRLWRLPGVEPVTAPVRPTALPPRVRFPLGGPANLVHFGGADAPGILVRNARDLTLRDPSDGRVLATLMSTGASSYPSAAVSADGGRIVVWPVSAATESASIWTADGRRIASGLTHQRGIRQMLFSPDGRRIASVGSDKDNVGELRIWDADLRPVAGPLCGHHNGVQAARWSADGRTIATFGLARGNAQELRFWTADGDPLPGVLPAPGRFSGFVGSSVGSVGSLFVACGSDGLLRLWDPLAGREVRSVRAFPENSGTAVVSPDGTVVAAVERSGARATLRFWRSESLEPIGKFEAAGAAFGQIPVFSGDGRRFIYGILENGAVRLRSYEIASGRDSGSPVAVPMLSFPQVQVSQDGRFAVVVTHPRGADLRAGDVDVRLWEVGTGRMTALAVPGSGRGMVQALFSADGRALAVVGPDGTVGVWPLATTPSAADPG